eukprot:c38020_g1_i1 orf=116-382(+)
MIARMCHGESLDSPFMVHNCDLRIALGLLWRDYTGSLGCLTWLSLCSLRAETLDCYLLYGTRARTRCRSDVVRMVWEPWGYLKTCMWW